MPFASMTRRTLAGIVDLVLAWVILYALLIANSLLPKEIARQTAEILSWAILPAYFGLLPATPLQGTLGKRLFGLRIADLAGQRIGLGRALIRFVASVASIALAGLGFAAAAWTPKRQALHDLGAGTLVLANEASPSRIHALASVAWTIFAVAMTLGSYVLLEFGYTRNKYDAISKVIVDTWVYLQDIDEARAAGRPPPPVTKLPIHTKSITPQPDGSVVLETTDEYARGGRIVFRRGDARWKCTLENIRLSYLPPECR